MPRTLLIANRRTPDQEEAEAVVVDTDRDGIVILELDDGERLELDPVELDRALHEAA